MIKATKNIFCLLFAFFTFLFHVLCCFLILKAVHLLEIPRRYKQPVYSFMKIFSHHAIVSVFGLWFPSPIYIKYSREVWSHRRNIVVSNHCSDYDWLFVGQSMLHLGQFHSLCILMKQSLYALPIIGFSMKLFGHVFLNRRRDRDAAIIDRHMKLLRGKKEYNVLIFPEGTYTHTKSCSDAKKFAKKSKLSVRGKPYVPDHVLLPRKLGFSIIRDDLGDSLEGVIDFTLLMNPYMKMPSEECSLLELFVQGTQVVNQAIIVSYVPREKLTEDFLSEAFYSKDKLLEEYVRFGGEIKDRDEFVRLLSRVSPITENDRVETIYMTSPYRLYFLATPLLPIIVWALAKIRSHI